jgi:ribosome-associated protein
VRELVADWGNLPAEVQRVVELALERKAEDLTVLDLRGISTATDYFVLASGRSDVQVKAIAEHIAEELKAEGHDVGHVEGLGGGRWALLDYIDFVVHVFHPQARAFYQLENLWGDAPRWDQPEEDEVVAGAE